MYTVSLHTLEYQIRNPYIPPRIQRAYSLDSYQFDESASIRFLVILLITEQESSSG